MLEERQNDMHTSFVTHHQTLINQKSPQYLQAKNESWTNVGFWNINRIE